MYSQIPYNYMGGGNMTTKIELTHDSGICGYIWAFDDASVLFRVKYKGTTVVTSFPKDMDHAMHLWDICCKAMEA